MDIRHLMELAGMDPDSQINSVGDQDFEAGSPNVGDEGTGSEDFSQIIERVKQDLQPLFDSEEGCDLLADLCEFIQESMSSCDDGSDQDVGDDITGGRPLRGGTGEI